MSSLPDVVCVRDRASDPGARAGHAVRSAQTVVGKMVFVKACTKSAHEARAQSCTGRCRISRKRCRSTGWGCETDYLPREVVPDIDDYDRV
jgi:hypothetical protein